MLFSVIQSKDIRKQLAVIFRLCVCSTAAPCILAVKDTPTAQLGNADRHTPYFYLCTLSLKSVKIGIIYSDILVFSLVYISSKDGLSLSKVYIQNITILYYFDKVAIFKCVRVVYLLVLISLVINAIILFIQTDCNAHKYKRRDLSYEPITAKHNKSCPLYHCGGIASRMTFPYSFSVTPHQTCFRVSVKTQWAQGRQERSGLLL